MSIKIELLFLNTPLLLLLILLLILLIFCYMQYYVYSSQPIMYNETDSKHTANKPYFADKINKIIKMKDTEIKKNIKLLSQIIKETKLTENFEDIDISVDDLQSNLDTLTTLESNLTDFENIDMSHIQSTMDLIKKQRMANKEKILDLLTNIYVLGNIDNINKGNAVSYKEYLKYQNLNNNKYYNQYR